MEALETFRQETREWLEANYPDGMKLPLSMRGNFEGGYKQKLPHPDIRVWVDRMAEKGWTVPTWPKEYGGAALSKEENKILREEMARLGCRAPIWGHGIHTVGPTLFDYGTEEQRQEHCPRAARGEVRWCQGYSEPNAGSDLASLQMRAEDMGDYFLVSGTKLWTSDANLAEWMFCLVRTNFEAENRRNGISLLLFPMDDPAISISPIELISGHSTFFETSIENLKVPKKNLVGEKDAGWGIGKALLAHERVMISGLTGVGGGSGEGGSARTAGDSAKAYVGEENGRVADPVLRDRIAQQDMDSQAFGLVGKLYAEKANQGENPGFASSMFKYCSTKLWQSNSELQIATAGTRGLGWEGEGFSAAELGMTRGWLSSKGMSIAGGTSEVMLNVVAGRVLGLPTK